MLIENGGRHADAGLPDYASQFHCIGPTCEDSCCTGWSGDMVGACLGDLLAFDDSGAEAVPGRFLDMPLLL